MPLPEPKPDEEESEFIERCMSDTTMVSEFPDNDQRLQVCQSQVDQSNDGDTDAGEHLDDEDELEAGEHIDEDEITARAMANAMAKSAKLKRTIISNSNNNNTDTNSKRRKANMARKNKTRRAASIATPSAALVLIDEEAVGEDATVVEVTVDTIKQNFPEIAEALANEGSTEAQEENEEVVEAAENADMTNEAEAQAVFDAFKGKLSASELSLKLLSIHKESRLATANSSAGGDTVPVPETQPGVNQTVASARADDQPSISTAGGGTGTPVKGGNTKAALKKLRGGRKGRAK